MFGHPALGDERLLRHVEAEEVEAVVDRLDLAHLGEPELQTARSRRYQPSEFEKDCLQEILLEICRFLSQEEKKQAHLRRCSWVWARMVLRSSMRVLTP